MTWVGTLELRRSCLSAAVGQIVFDSQTAEEVAEQGMPVVLLRQETSPEDVKGMHRSQGVLTQLGGMTSHAAVVARGWGKPCITGCADLKIDNKAKTATLGGKALKQGDIISLNGTTGEVIFAEVPVKAPELKGNAEKFMKWVDEHRTLKVYANADLPADAAQVCA
jgi:pyruvate,orthophosphate dikinase